MKKALPLIILLLVALLLFIVITNRDAGEDQDKVGSSKENIANLQWNTFSDENSFYSLKYPKDYFVSSLNEREVHITSYDTIDDPAYRRGLKELKFEITVIPGPYSDFERYYQVVSGDIQIYTHKNWGTGSRYFVILNKYSHIVTDSTRNKTLGLHISDPSGKFTSETEEILNSIEFSDEPLSTSFLTYKDDDPTPFPPSAFGISYPHNFQVQSEFGEILVGPYYNFENFYHHTYRFDFDTSPWLVVRAFWDIDMHENTPEKLLQIYTSPTGTWAFKNETRNILTGRTLEIDGYEAFEVISSDPNDKGTSWILTTFPDISTPRYYFEGDLSGLPVETTPTPTPTPEDSPLFVYIESNLENFEEIPEGTVESIISTIDIDL